MRKFYGKTEADMLKLALIGKDVSKSDSAKMHTFDLKEMGSGCTYELISLAKEDFSSGHMSV